jgi:hypothetical protein
MAAENKMRPLAAAKVEEAAKEIHAGRKRLVAKLDALDQKASITLPHKREEHEKLQAEIIAAREHLYKLERKLVPSQVSCVFASFEFDARRAEIEKQLKATASPLIAEFIAEMREEHERIRKAPVMVDGEINKRSWSIDRKTMRDNMASRLIRFHAVRHAIEDAGELYLMADQSEVPARLDKLRDGLPDDNKFGKAGRNLSLSDLKGGIPFEEAFAKYCGGILG